VSVEVEHLDGVLRRATVVWDVSRRATQ
jgi:hypothetical protein